MFTSKNYTESDVNFHTKDVTARLISVMLNSNRINKNGSSTKRNKKDLEPRYLIPDFIEIECTKTKMYKLIAEGYCFKSPDYTLCWKVSPCKVDLTIKNALFQGQDNKLERQIKHEATLHTLRYVPNGHGIANKLGNLISSNYVPIPDYNGKDNVDGYLPPEIYDISGGLDSTNNSTDIESVNNMDDFRNYVQTNMV